MEKIVKENSDKRKLDDERMENFIQKFDASFKELVGSNESKMKMKIKECDDKIQKEDKEINKLMKSLEECFQRLLLDSEKKMDMKMQELKQIDQVVSSPVVKAGVIIMTVKHRDYEKCSACGSVNNCDCIYYIDRRECIVNVCEYNVDMVSFPDTPQLDPPSDVVVDESSSTLRYTYRNESCFTTHVERDITRDVMNILTQLIAQGYQLFTANIPLEKPVLPYSFMLIRSSK